MASNITGCAWPTGLHAYSASGTCTRCGSQRGHVQTTDAMLTTDAVVTMVATRYGVEELTDGAARTVAGWYASSGTVGHVLASLSMGRPVELEALLDDIAATRHGALWTTADATALDMLATWAIDRNRVNR